MKNHITQILQKTDLRDRTQLAIYAFETLFNGLYRKPSASSRSFFMFKNDLSHVMSSLLLMTSDSIPKSLPKVK